MFVATSTTAGNSNHPPSYIVANSNITTTTNNGTDPTTTNNNTTTQTLSDIKLICVQRKKRSKRHIYLTFIESRPLSSSTEEPCIEIIRKSSSSSSSQPLIYSLNDCISYEYFDTVKNDFQTFIYVYFESYTISIFFSEENFDRKQLIIKHLEYMSQDKTSELSNNSSQDNTQSQSQSLQNQQSQQPSSSSVLPCPSTAEHILHTFDVNLIPYGPIIHREHVLVGPARLYLTSTDLYISSINFNRQDLKITIRNQCPPKDKAILCIPYFTIKNYGNRSNIFLIELGKSNYGNGEIHMKCHSSTLASTIHLLVSPVIEERPLILSSAFHQLLTTKRMEKSKNIQPPIQLNHDAINSSNTSSNNNNNESPLPLIRQQPIDTNDSDSKNSSTTQNDIKSNLVMGFFRSLSKNVAHLKRSATMHYSNNNSNNNNEQSSTLNSNSLPKNKYVAFNIDDKKIHHDHQHQIILPDSQKKFDTISTSTNSSNITKHTTETILTSTTTINTIKQESTLGTYIDMGPTIQKLDVQQKQEVESEVITKEHTATADIGVNTTISLSPYVRSAIIVGNSVHLIADDKTLFPIGPRSFTSPASVMQPFKTQLNGQTVINPYATTSDLIKSSPDSSNSLHQLNSVSNSQQSLFLSYGIVTFNTNDLLSNDQSERPTSPPSDGSTLDCRLNSDISLMSTQQQGSTIYPLDSLLTSSNAPIFRTLSVSTNNIGDTASTQLRTPHGSILFIDDHSNDQTATYLLGAPINPNDETIPTNLTRPSSFNLTTSISRPQLSNIVEEKSSSIDPYALIEPLSSHDNSPASTSLKNLAQPLPTSEKSLNYVDLLLPTHENSDSNEQQQNNDTDVNNDDNNHLDELENEKNELSTTKLYTDIDFLQTQRRDRIVQSAAKAKMEDQAPPFVL